LKLNGTVLLQIVDSETRQTFYPGSIKMLMRLLSAILVALSSYSFAVDGGGSGEIIGFQSSVEDQFIKLDWSMSVPKYSIGDPVFAQLSITNKSSEMLYVVYSNPIEISNPSIFQDGKTIPLTAYGTSNKVGGLNHISIKLSPGKSSTTLVFLSRQFDISMAGIFRAVAQVHYLDGKGKTSVLNAAPIQFEIEDLPDNDIFTGHSKK
jgi:hypothetical protein